MDRLGHADNLLRQHQVQTFVLAGGLGTRLRPVSGSTPKVMMPVAGEPFLQRLLARLVVEGIPECVLCLGYGAQDVIQHFTKHSVNGLKIHFSIESEPRGTAGALRVAETFWAQHNLVLNGDTDLIFDIPHFYQYHIEKCALLTIGLVNASDASRFGRARLAEDGRLLAFLEKDGLSASAMVNAGVYFAERSALASIPVSGAASIERDWLPSLLSAQQPVYGLVIAKDFIDIGTPDDYRRLVNRV